MLQCFVRTADLDKVYAAEEKVLAAANVNAMKLEAFKYYYAPAGAAGRRGHLREADAGNPQAASGHHCRREAVSWRKPAPSARSPPRTTIPPPTRPSSNTCPRSCRRCAGENFNPHVSTGVAPTEYLDQMLAEPFEPFTFSPAGAAVYQLGPFGTAAKKLKEWD